MKQNNAFTESAVHSTDSVYPKGYNGGWQHTARNPEATCEKKFIAIKSVGELKFRCIFIG
jgi:hypothetical protein